MRAKTLRKAVAAVFLGIVGLHLAFVLATSSAIILYRFVNPPVTGIQMYRTVFYRWPTEKRRYLPLKKIPSRTRKMVIKVEDGTFYEHHGVILAAMKNAWKLNQGLGKNVYGGSTITMQTARTLFLVPEKNYVRKYLEIIVALEMEAFLGKDRILELYLNYAEWGKGVYGIEAAARHYYGKGVASLSVDQAIRLVTLLSSPIKYSPTTISKSAILRSRYRYLTNKFN